MQAAYSFTGDFLAPDHERISRDMSDIYEYGLNLISQNKLEEARELFWFSARKIIESEGSNSLIVNLPSIGGIGKYEGDTADFEGDRIRSPLYTNISPYRRTLLAVCCNGMAKYYIAKDDLESALEWLEEVHVLYQNLYFREWERPLYDWFDHAIDFPLFTFHRVTALTTSGEIFHRLGNTATAGERRWVATSTTQSLPLTHSTPQVKKMIATDKLTKAISLRNPDPSLCHKLTLTHPRLQVRGSWRKLQLKPGEKSIAGRMKFSSFIWKSRLYVFGGWQGYFSNGDPFFKDFWCLDLDVDDSERKWRRLADYPSKIPAAIGWSFVVEEDEGKAYLITGKSQIDYFELANETWGRIKTTYTPTEEDKKVGGVKGNWPFPGQTLADSTVIINKRKIYTFGGDHGDTSLGCNLFMELDLDTQKWKRLSGYVQAPLYNDYDLPGPRVSACGWVDSTKDRIYICFGQANRDGAHMKGERHGSESAFAYNDFWSWDLEGRKWRRERMSGNPPALRTEMACTFNEKLNKAILFGGYAPCISTLHLEKGIQYNYTYYADTFVYDGALPDSSSSPSPSSGTSSLPLASSLTPWTSKDPEQVTAPSETSHPGWRQVLTRGFPTYRCHAHLHTDSATGKVYLFGGYTNTDFVPSRGSFLTRPFSDVWQLRLDGVGPIGDFAHVDVEEEARTAGAGPWQRCFGCGNAGRWRKCSGACKGKAFFCGVECQREGWKEHKKVHGCRKL